MASCLLNCELVDIQNKLYRMTWWATALNQITVPGNMTMSGGSKAIITDSSGVKYYFYNESTSSWKLYEGSSGGSAELEGRVSSLENNVRSLSQDIDTYQLDGVFKSYAGIQLRDNSGTWYVDGSPIGDITGVGWWNFVYVDTDEETEIFGELGTVSNCFRFQERTYTTRYNQDIEADEYVVTQTFSRIIYSNGTPTKIGTFRITDVAGSWDDLQNATISYQETNI